MAPIVINEQILHERLNAFKPEPLITLSDEIDNPIEIPMVNEDENNIDLAKTNFLNLINHNEIESIAEKTIREYGVGTCGPRAFYGTTDVHLELEERLAEFLHVEESIIYSYGFVAISSSIAAYCKKNDVVFVDEFANFPIGQGLQAAKSKVIKFKHNNPISLREEITKIIGVEKRPSRKFLIIEGISWKTGKLCPLPQFLDVAEEFKMRVFLEESYTLGILGKSGRGLTEHFNIDPSRIDMMFGTLEGAIGSIGGYCAGSNLIIEHQRLSGSGYIFSASLPTYLAKVVLKALEIFDEKPVKFLEFTKKFHKFLVDNKYDVVSDPESPFKVIRVENCDRNIYDYLKTNGLHVLKNDLGLVINLNLKFFEDKDKLGKIEQVFISAQL